MKITAITTHPVSIALSEPVWTAHEANSHSAVILVEVQTDEGVSGVGQIHASPMAEVCKWVERLGEVALGMDPREQSAVWDKLFSLTNPRPGALPAREGVIAPLPRSARPQIMAAIGGIDIALWDIKGKAAGMPVYRLLGGENQPVYTYATGGYYRASGSSTACADELAGFVAAGLTGVKLKCCGLAMEAEIERIQATRKAIGDEPLFMLDMNAPYAVDECIRFAKRVEPFDIFWLEEPLHWYLQPADFVRLAQATPIPLAHGERELTRFTVRDFIATSAIRYVQFDSTRAAGFTESLRIAHLAEQHGVRIAPHTAPELHAHLCAAFPGASFGVESHIDPQRNPVSHGMYLDCARRKGSYVYLNDKPGFGIEIDWKFIARHKA
jgi:L-alanine-DL-glutamate epimerase-like enolase superfamily enzyme